MKLSIMEKFIPYEKLSKKEKRKQNQANRQTWGELKPVTRKPENSKVYNRKKSQAWKRELPPTACDFYFGGLIKKLTTYFLKFGAAGEAKMCNDPFFGVHDRFPLLNRKASNVAIAGHLRHILRL